MNLPFVKYLSEKQKNHMILHGWDTLVGGKIIIYLNSEKTKFFPVRKTKRPTKLERVKKAFRKAIQPQISRFRKANNRLLKEGYRCPVTNIRVLNWKQAHVDHVYPFCELLYEFYTINNIVIEDIKLDRKGEIKDESILNRWVVFHERQAKLGILSKEANLRKGSLTPDTIKSDARYSDLLPYITNK